MGRHRIKFINQSDSACHTTTGSYTRPYSSPSAAKKEGQKGWISPVHFPARPVITPFLIQTHFLLLGSGISDRWGPGEWADTNGGSF